MSYDGFEYYYHIKEESEQSETIANYASNSIPPTVGTTLTFTESMGHSRPLRCKVLSVEMIPGKSPGDKRGTSTYTKVVIRVEVLPDEPDGSEWLNNILART